MSTVKTTNLQHPSAPSPNLVLNADGSVTGGGVIVAVKHALFTGTQSASVAAGASFSVTDLSITHTLADASNKLIISAYVGVGAWNGGQGRLGLAVADGGTLIAVGDAAGNRIRVAAGGRTASANSETVVSPSIMFVYEPGDTASHTYTVEAINLDGATAAGYVNRNVSDADTNNRPRGSSGFVIQEVKV